MLQSSGGSTPGRKSFSNKKATPIKKPVQEPSPKKAVQEPTTRKSLQEAAARKSVQESPAPVPAPVLAEVSKPAPAPVPVSTKATPKSAKASASPAYKAKAAAKKTPQISTFLYSQIIFVICVTYALICCYIYVIYKYYIIL